MSTSEARKWPRAGQTERVHPCTIAFVSAIESSATARPSGRGGKSHEDQRRLDEIATADRRLDAISRSWLAQLQPSHPRHHEAVARLHLTMRSMAMRELRRRHRQLLAVTGPEFDDLAEQAADDALVGVLSSLDSFRGLSRFTTWVYKLVMREVSTKVAAHAWHRQPPNLSEELWEHLPDPVRRGPEEALEHNAQLRALRDAIGELSERQRHVFVSIALNEVSIDVVALKLGTNRNAVYKSLFDARQRLRALMAAAGHPVDESQQCEGNDSWGPLGTEV
jgi:RNA polymerase sigma-70 factor (ECF subfamily)